MQREARASRAAAVAIALGLTATMSCRKSPHPVDVGLDASSVPGPVAGASGTADAASLDASGDSPGNAIVASVDGYVMSCVDAVVVTVDDGNAPRQPSSVQT
jgi:hypothetical protein